jgi:AAT family amino acid transporter
MEEQNNNHLRRSMTTGQMEMIAIGGTIGSGLFMGATSTY